MNVFFEENGDFKIASIMTESDSSLQIESASGKRSKIKSAQVMLKFEGALAGFMETALAEADTLDTDFLWECCGEAEFCFEELAKEYYGGKPSSQHCSKSEQHVRRNCSRVSADVRIDAVVRRHVGSREHQVRFW